MPRKFLLFLFLQILLASCAVRQEGDPLVLAWERFCTGREDLEDFRAALAEVRSSDGFRLKAMDSPELEELARSLAGADGADAAAPLMLRYIVLNEELEAASSRTVALVMSLLSLFSVLSTVFFIFYIRQAGRLLAVQSRLQTERAVGDATIRMQEEERTRIYQELHDTVMQDIRSALFSLRALHKYLPGNAEAEELYRSVETLGRESITGVRDTIHNIIPPDLLHNFATVLREWTTDFSIRSGIRCNVSIRSGAALDALDQTQRLHLFRIIQEALFNVRKHSGAAEATVLIRPGRTRAGEGTIVAVVGDDGAGFDPRAAAGSADGHFGIQGMYDRAAVLDGSCRITSFPGDGTQVYVEIPLKGARARG